MQNFSYCNPTRLVFGRDSETQAGRFAAPYATDSKKVLVIYGGGSAKRSGVLDRVTQSCEAAGLTCVVKGGVQPNPTIEFVREAVELARAENIDAIIAVGGGSVIDSSKATAMGLKYDGDVWDFFSRKAVPQEATPVIAVLTIPAAGSESSIRCVITNGDEKFGAGTEVIRPKAAMINPELFYTLPKKQVAAGVFDMMSHIMERYFTNTTGVDFTSSQAEAALRCIMRNGTKLIENQEDYDAWCQIGLAGSYAHNGFFGLGHEEDWACHGIEHAVSGWRTEITHGCGLAVITPAWMHYVWPANPERFLRWAKEVMGVELQPEGEEATVKLAIARFMSFIQVMGLPLHLSELGFGEVPVDEVADLAMRNGPLGHFKVLGRNDVATILRNAQ